MVITNSVRSLIMFPFFTKSLMSLGRSVLLPLVYFLKTDHISRKSLVALYSFGLFKICIYSLWFVYRTGGFNPVIKCAVTLPVYSVGRSLFLFTVWLCPSSCFLSGCVPLPVYSVGMSLFLFTQWVCSLFLFTLHSGCVSSPVYSHPLKLLDTAQPTLQLGT